MICRGLCLALLSVFCLPATGRAETIALTITLEKNVATLLAEKSREQGQHLDAKLVAELSAFEAHLDTYLQSIYDREEADRILRLLRTDSVFIVGDHVLATKAGTYVEQHWQDPQALIVHIL